LRATLEDSMSNDLPQNMQKCRQTHNLQNRAVIRFVQNHKATIIVLVGCITALLVLSVGILLPMTRFNQAHSTKSPCPEGGECNVRVRSYNNEVLNDITDIYPGWSFETSSQILTNTYLARQESLTLTSTKTIIQRDIPVTMPIVVLLKTVNCRKGPGMVYAVVAYLQQGSTAYLVGRNSDWSWWLIQPSDRMLQCWVWSELVKTNDDIQQVPFATSLPPPTLTSTPEPQGNGQIGCWVTTIQYPNGICLPRACGPNDYPGTSCTP
jgi:SH3-like domain-containing protein